MNPSIVLVGLPKSGKSSYLGALRHLLVSREVETAIELERFAGDETHANALSGHWHDVLPFDRTSMLKEGQVTVIASRRDTDDTLTLHLPDLSGERFRQLAGSRSCPESLHSALLGADGVLLFVNAWKEFEDASKDEVGHPSEMPAKAWDPEAMPEQAHLLEILNFLNRYPATPKRRRLAVIVSAWDVVEPDHAEPASWLGQHRFMLWRYLSNNRQLFDTRAYGVSALGGDPEDPETAERLRSIAEASRRIGIVGHDAGPHDISAPLLWLAGG